jgi:hypothetical protein
VRRCAAIVAALVVAAVVTASAGAATGIVGAQTSLPQGPYRFGEQVTADLDLVVNPELVDPGAVRASEHFDPYEVVGSPHRRTLHEGPVTRVRFRYLIQCASLACTMGPSRRQRQIAFRPAVVSYTTRDGTQRTTKVPWERIVLVTRINDPLARPQTATQVRLPTIPIEPLLRLPLSVKAPPPSYRISPATLAVVLVLASLLAFAGAAVAASPLLALARRAEDAGPPLSPLEQALLAVESAAQRLPGSADHREALALLARQLRRSSSSELVNAARKLAWSENAPTAAESRALTRDVRARTEHAG